MIAFNLKLFCKVIYVSLFQSRGTHFRLTGKRIKALIVLLGVFIIGNVAGRISFILDYLLFGRFRKQEIKEPVFIIGNFRSGSTFLHRLLSRDSRRFSCFHTWEIYAAPAVSTRKLLRGLKLLDGLLGRPVMRLFGKIEEKVHSTVSLHRIGIFEPEEEEGLFFYIVQSLFLWFFFPDYDLFKPYLFFDKMIPSAQKRRFMHFYRKCLKRHLFAHGGNRQFLSKNPSFTPRIRTLHTFFPDAKIIYLVRNPVDNFPSMASWFSFCFNAMNTLKEKYPFKREIMDIMKHWYTYPVEELAKLPKNRRIIVKYDDLVDDPMRTVQTIYDRFGYTMSPQFRKIVEKEQKKAKQFKSSRKQSEKEIGISHAEVNREFREIKQYFGFDTK